MMQTKIFETYWYKHQRNIRKAIALTVMDFTHAEINTAVRPVDCVVTATIKPVSGRTNKAWWNLLRCDLGKSPLDQIAKMHTPSQIKDLLLGTWTKGEAGTLTELHELKRPPDFEERYARDCISRKR